MGAGIDFEPGKPGHCGEFGRLSLTRSGTKRKSPPHWVVNSPSSQAEQRTSATG